MDIVTLAASRKYTDKKIMESGAVGIKYEIVDSLPSSGEAQTIYFVKNNNSLINDYYDEYVWISSSSVFEKIGSTQIDGSAIQADWNQNDDTQLDYIKNRPFYTGDPVETVLVEETTLTFEDNGEGLYVGPFETTFLPIVGKTYKISWDGSVYESTCIEFYESLVIGNLSIVGEESDTGEPFVFSRESSGRFFIGTLDTVSSHTISISETVTPVVKIDPKYIRDMYYTGDPVETVFVEESTVAFAENHGLYAAKFKTTFVPTVGETYKVSWDGTVYECACVDAKNDKVIGNLSIVGEESDTGEPFVMGGFDGRGAGIYTADTSASHTFSISGITISVVKIDEKYLPDTVATKSDVEDAKTTANAAKTTANAAKTTAKNAQTTANAAKTTAENAQTTANAAKTTAETAQTTASAKFQLMQQNTVTTTTTIGTIRNSVGSVLVKGLNIAVGSIIKFTADNNVSGKTVWDSPTKQIKMTNSAGATVCLLGLELSHDGETYYFTNKTISSILSNLVIEYEKVIIPKIIYPGRNEGAWLPPYLIANCLYLTKQSTSTSSATLYRITVDDSGTLTAKEVT